jgi:hypothetical protein
VAQDVEPEQLGAEALRGPGTCVEHLAAVAAAALLRPDLDVVDEPPPSVDVDPQDRDGGVAVVRRPQVVSGSVQAVGQLLVGRSLGRLESGGEVGVRAGVDHVLGVRHHEVVAVPRELVRGHRPQVHAGRHGHGQRQVQLHLRGLEPGLGVRHRRLGHGVAGAHVERE